MTWVIDFVKVGGRKENGDDREEIKSKGVRVVSPINMVMAATTN